MNARRFLLKVLAVMLGLVGGLLVLFEFAMVGSEPDLFMKGGWVVFLAFTLIGVAMLAGGIWLLVRSHGKY